MDIVIYNISRFVGRLRLLRSSKWELENFKLNEYVNMREYIFFVISK